MSDIVKVDGLSRDEIRQNLISSLKSTGRYKDWDFRASGISALLDILSNHAYLFGFYSKMAVDEAFIQTTKTKEGMRAHCQTRNFLPNGKKCAEANFKIVVRLLRENDPSRGYVTIRRGSTINSVNETADQRIFNITEHINIYNKTFDDTYVYYHSNDFIAYEGSIRKWRSEVDHEIQHQRFVIREHGIDINTMRIFVKPDVDSEDGVEFTYAKNAIKQSPNDNVFYVIVSPEGFYEIFFGDNIIGKKPDNASIVEVEYIVTNGLNGNGAIRYNFNSNIDSDHDLIDSIDIIESSTSHGGKDEDSIELTRFLLQNDIKTQNRLVVASDFRKEIIHSYGSIETINVWGGEKNHHVQYGKVFISAKPKYAERLNTAAKQSITQSIVKELAIVATDVVFVDPEFLDVKVNIKVVVDQSLTKKTLNTIENEITNDVSNYNSNNLGVFHTLLSSSDLINQIKRKDTPYIMSCYADMEFAKSVDIIPGSTSNYAAIFGNPIDSNYPIYSNYFKYGTSDKNLIDAQLIVVGNNIFLYDKNGRKILNQSFGSIEYTKDNTIISFNVPRVAKFDNLAVTSNISSITWNAIPKNPDIFTYNNNIVRITNIGVDTSVWGMNDE